MRHNTELEVDLRILKENFDLLKTFAPTNEVIFMVKADAYGHGVASVAKYAKNNLGINRLGVASLGEAIHLVEKCPDLDAEIWVFSDNELENVNENSAYLENPISPVISTLDQLQYFLENEKFKNVSIILKFDTGMNRLGIDHQNVTEVIDLLKKHSINKIKHLMTHFSCSFYKLKDGDRTYQQYEKFKKIKERFSKEGIEFEESSVANSGAIEQKFGLDETHIRPGLMLYGPRSVGSFKKDEAIWKGRSISSLKTNILKVMPVLKGTPIGYGGHVCSEDGIILYLPMGYGDGILTYYSGLKIQFKDKWGEILGRINMDLIAVYFKNAEATYFQDGHEVIIWDHSQEGIVDLSNQVGTIPYQVYTALTSRIPRKYIHL